MQGTKVQRNIAYKGYRVRKAAFEGLWIWKESHSLMLEMHRILNNLPQSEMRLIDQGKRSSSSVPDNIAEAYGAYYYKDKLKCFYVSRKESRETQNHVKSLSSKGLIKKEKEVELISRYEGVIIGINNFVKYLIKKNEK
jgi:four helix bundle protein